MLIDQSLLWNIELLIYRSPYRYFEYWNPTIFDLIHIRFSVTFRYTRNSISNYISISAIFRCEPLSISNVISIGTNFDLRRCFYFHLLFDVSDYRFPTIFLCEHSLFQSIFMWILYDFHRFFVWTFFDFHRYFDMNYFQFPATFLCKRFSISSYFTYMKCSIFHMLFSIRFISDIDIEN